MLKTGNERERRKEKNAKNRKDGQSHVKSYVGFDLASTEKNGKI